MGIDDIYKLSEQTILPEEFVYTSLDELPVEEIPEGYEDGDNSLLAEHPGGVPMTDVQRVEQAQRNADANLRLMLNRKMVVPLARELKLTKPNYMKGKDVLALQRALARAGFRKWGNFTGIFGDGTKKQVQKFQEKNGLKADGVYGTDTHKKLARYYDSYGAHLMVQTSKILIPDKRVIIISYATFGYNNRYKIHYTQSSLRMYGVRNHVKPPSIPYYEDCSSFSTWCYWGAKMPDPNGFGYNGFGYTGTLAIHGRLTVNPRPGDLAFYGPFPHRHVVVCIGNGKCISHGSEIGPIVLPVHYRSDFSHYRTYNDR